MIFHFSFGILICFKDDFEVSTPELLEEITEDTWANLLDSWEKNTSPSNVLIKLIKQGIPENYRGQVWQKLCRCADIEEMIDKYQNLILKVN